MTITFDHTTLGQRVLFGTGKAADHTADAIAGLGAERVLLVADRFAINLADEIVGKAPIVARIHDIVQHVPVENGRAAVDLAGSEAIDAVVAIGGGSATGLAKFVARDTGVPIIAVPSTFAGSEATNVWGQTEGRRKTTGVDDRVVPKVIVYDASLSRSLPGRLAVSSGLNAVAHAIDGLWAPRADPINVALATEGVRALVPGLRALHAEPDDLEGRETALYGAYLAAVAFASAGSGMHHKICHVLGGAYNLSHAEMHATVLPYVAAYNAPEAPEAMERIARIFDVETTRAPHALADFRDELGITGGLAALGLHEPDIPEAARLATESIPPSNPRHASVEDIENIIRAAWAGGPIEN